MTCNHENARTFKYRMSLGGKTTQHFKPVYWAPDFFVSSFCPVCGVEGEPQTVRVDLTELNLKKAAARHSLVNKLQAIEAEAHVPDLPYPFDELSREIELSTCQDCGKEFEAFDADPKCTDCQMIDADAQADADFDAQGGDSDIDAQGGDSDTEVS